MPTDRWQPRGGSNQSADETLTIGLSAEQVGNGFRNTGRFIHGLSLHKLIEMFQVWPNV